MLSDIGQLQAALTEAEVERENATNALATSEQNVAKVRTELEQLRTAFAEADEARGTARAQLAEAQTTIDTLRSGQTEAEERLALLDAELQQSGRSGQGARTRALGSGRRNRSIARQHSPMPRVSATTLQASSPPPTRSVRRPPSNSPKLKAPSKRSKSDRTDLQRRLAAATLQVQTAVLFLGRTRPPASSARAGIDGGTDYSQRSAQPDRPARDRAARSRCRAN